MRAYQCSVCGKIVAPDEREFHHCPDLTWVLLEGIKLYEVWQPVMIYRYYTVLARSEEEAMEQYQKGAGEYQFGDPYCEDPHEGNCQLLPGADVHFLEDATEELTADQAWGICRICGDLVFKDDWRDHLISHGTAFGSTDSDPEEFFDKE